MSPLKAGKVEASKTGITYKPMGNQQVHDEFGSGYFISNPSMVVVTSPMGDNPIGR